MILIVVEKNCIRKIYIKFFCYEYNLCIMFKCDFIFNYFGEG